MQNGPLPLTHPQREWWTAAVPVLLNHWVGLCGPIGFDFFPSRTTTVNRKQGDGATLIGLALIIDVILLMITQPDEEIKE